MIRSRVVWSLIRLVLLVSAAEFVVQGSQREPAIPKVYACLLCEKGQNGRFFCREFPPPTGYNSCIVAPNGNSCMLSDHC
jgi:hypothetical protein